MRPLTNRYLVASALRGARSILRTKYAVMHSTTRIRREFQCFRSKWPEKPAFHHPSGDDGEGQIKDLFAIHSQIERQFTLHIAHSFGQAHRQWGT